MTILSKLAATSSAQTGDEEPTCKRVLDAAVGSLQAATGSVVEFLGIHLTKGAVRVVEVKETRQEISQITADVNTAKLAILAGVCLYGVCVAGSLLKNIFQRGSGGGNDRSNGSVQERQLVFVVPPRE